MNINKIRRINLYGGPGCGKSRTAAWLYSELKDRDITCELVREEIKLAAYKKEPITGFDQLDYFTRQLRQEELWLRNGVDLIVTDCPVFLNTLYANMTNIPYADELTRISEEFDRKYPCFNIVLARPDCSKYNPRGRYETPEEAFLRDIFILGGVATQYGQNNVSTYVRCDSLDRKEILKVTLKQIWQSN